MQSTEGQDTPVSLSISQDASSDFDAIFARRLHDFRTIAGLTQQQMADRMHVAGYDNIHRSTIGKIESSDRPVSLGEAVSLARILGVDLDDLVTESGGRATGEMAKALIERENWARQLRELEQYIERTERELHQARQSWDFAHESFKKAMRAVEALEAKEGK